MGNDVDTPTALKELARRDRLKAEADPPEEVELSLGRYDQLYRANIDLREARDRLELVARLPGKEIGRRVFPPDIEAVGLDPRQVEDIDPDKEADGLRPGFLPLAFAPERIELQLHERVQPPADFDYKRADVDQPTSVFPPDDRYIYQDTSYPWCMVGRVDTPLGSCTGCMIGPRLLLTGNHCIQWNPDGTAGWVRFRPSYYNGSAPFGEAWAERVVFWITTTPGDGLSDQETAFDYVVCVLGTRMGDTVGYAGYRTYSSDWNGGDYWQHMGYPSDLSGGERPAFVEGAISTSANQNAAGQEGRVLGHFIDIVTGHSGGPVWGWWGEEFYPRVVGTQSAQSASPAMNTSGDNEFGGGPALSSLISWSRSNFP